MSALAAVPADRLVTVAPLSTRKRTLWPLISPFTQKWPSIDLRMRSSRPAATTSPSPRLSAMTRLPSAMKSSLSAKATKAARKMSTQPANILSPWPIGIRRTISALGDEDEDSDQIDEAQRLIAVVHSSISMPS